MSVLKKAQESKAVNPGRHAAECKICAHPQREEIEQQFVAWASPNRIAKSYGISRDSVYRHAHAGDLFSKRRVNVRAALERIIENAGEVPVNAAAVVAAVSTYSRLNSRGEWIEKREMVDMNVLFERMSTQELEQYAQNGTLPAWFPATGMDGQGGKDEQ